jgi:hypothetical protein
VPTSKYEVRKRKATYVSQYAAQAPEKKEAAALRQKERPTSHTPEQKKRGKEACRETTDAGGGG